MAYHLLRDVEVEITLEIGRRKMRIADVLKLVPGQTLPLSKAAGEPLDLYVNGRLLGRGERRLGQDEHRHQAVAQRLDDLAAHRFDDACQQRHALRDHRRRLGVAHRLVQRGAATQVGEQDGALDDLGAHPAGEAVRHQRRAVGTAQHPAGGAYVGVGQGGAAPHSGR